VVCGQALGTLSAAYLNGRNGKDDKNQLPRNSANHQRNKKATQ
jgi:hypothetical protein